MIATRKNVYKTGRNVPADKIRKIDRDFKAHDYHYGVHKIVLREKKLMEADMVLACSPVIMVSMIVLNYFIMI